MRSSSRKLSSIVFSACLVASAFALGGDASAGLQWCEDDPVFVVNGAIIDVTTAFPSEHMSSIKGPIEFELLVPANATAAVVALPGAVPATGKVTHSLPAYRGLLAVPVVVRVTVPASASFEIRTRVTGTYAWVSSTVYGKSNVTTTVKYYLFGL
ncbi:MAG TPA: hypothetical protein VGR87_07590 [Candidatus Limnocylindria bacterium]|nr:hypothetical protein [Candidatus Limnocylindria bacterium]